MTTGRINQVAFLRDAGTRTTPAHESAEASTRGQDIVLRNCMHGQTEEDAIAPPAHTTFCIRKHGQQYMGHSGRSDTLGTHTLPHGPPLPPCEGRGGKSPTEA